MMRWLLLLSLTACSGSAFTTGEEPFLRIDAGSPDAISAEGAAYEAALLEASPEADALPAPQDAGYEFAPAPTDCHNAACSHADGGPVGCPAWYVCTTPEWGCTLAGCQFMSQGGANTYCCGQ